MPDAVVFDFDGIIVDTEPIHYEAYQEILVPLGLGFSWSDYMSHYIGLDDREIFSRTFESKARNLNNQGLRQLMAQKASIFQDIVRSGIRPYPGVLELIGQLTGSLPLALCSGALRSDIVPVLKQLELFDAFDSIVTADDVAASKPDPASYKLVIEKLSAVHPRREINPRFSLAIEDTPAGIASAKAAGINALAVTNTYPAEKLADAIHVIDSLTRLNSADLDSFLHPRQRPSEAAQV